MTRTKPSNVDLMNPDMMRSPSVRYGGPMAPPAFSTRYYHRWDTKTGAYCGTTTTRTGGVPVDSSYQYEEYTPPKRPEPDGWYVVTSVAGFDRIVNKRGNDVYDLDGDKVDSHTWDELTVLSKRIDIIWLDRAIEDEGR